MNTKNTRTIHTHLYSKIANEILSSVLGQLSDGMWENSPSAKGYWMFANIKVADDGEILINVSAEAGEHERYGYHNKWIENKFYGLSDNEILEFFAHKAKAIARQELKDEDIATGWKRDSKFETVYLSYNEKITVGHVYFVYEFLLDRDVTKHECYANGIMNEVIGHQRSSEDTEKAAKCAAMLKDLDDSFTAAYNKLKAEKEAMIKKLEDEFNKNYAALREHHMNDRKAIEREMA